MTSEDPRKVLAAAHPELNLNPPPLYLCAHGNGCPNTVLVAGARCIYHECVICGEPTANGRPATIGNRAGVACEDCAYWCDGNLDGSDQR